MNIRCPECEAKGQRSMLLPNGNINKTLMNIDRFMDADEKEVREHVHDPNEVLSRPMKCSKGHRWIDFTPVTCWCGWSRDNRIPVNRRSLSIR